MASIDNALWAQQRLSHCLSVACSSGFREILRTLDLEGTLADIEFENQLPQEELWQAWQDPFWYRLPTNLPEGAAFDIGCAKDTARGIARVIAGDDDLPDTTVIETYLEVVKQSANAVGAAFAENAGTSVEFAQAAETSAPAGGAMGFQLQFKLEGANHLLAVVPSETMLEWMHSSDCASQAPQSPDETGDTVPTGEKDADEGAGLGLSTTATYNLELLMDVELDLSVSFGRTQLLLEDVLKLASGSIVELNRSATDPVDVLVNDAVIARGEVVVVEGNYGIRVTEVVSRKERIRSIF